MAKYSVPDNYKIKEFNGLKGLMRGDKWIWEPNYKHLVVGRSYGKIIVAHLSAYTSNEFLTLSDYRGNELMHMPIYDLIIGENFLYIKTERPSTKQVEWCLVDPELSKGTFVGKFEVTGRSETTPFHIAIGTTTMAIEHNGEQKIIDLISGEISDIPKAKVEVKEKVEVVTHYNIYIDEDTNTIQLASSASNRLIKQSSPIGELVVYTEIIKAILGSLKSVPKVRAEKLLAFLSTLDNWGNAIIFPVLYEYVKSRTAGDIDSILNAMIKEVSEGWKKLDDKNYIKIYMSGTVTVALIKSANSKITVVPSMLGPDNPILDENEILAVGSCYKENKAKTLKLNIVNAVLNERQKGLEIEDFPAPYCIVQRKILAADIKQFKYDSADIYSVDSEVLDDNNKKHGNVVLQIAVCNGFSYISKQKFYGKLSGWVNTNNFAALIL